MSDENTAPKVVAPEVIQRLKDLQTTFDRLTKHYGELVYQKMLLLKEIATADSLMEQLEEERGKVTQELTGAFGGPGSVNLETGEFVSAS